MLDAAREQTAAAARGDAAAALEAFRRRGYPSGAGDEQELAFLERLGDDAPDWLIGRWACETAFDWMLECEDPRVEPAAWALAATHDPPPPGVSPTEVVQRFQQIAAHDVLAHQLALFELGGLADFVNVRAGARLLERAPRLAEWASRQWSVFEQVRLRDDVHRVRDVANDESYDVLHLGAANGVSLDVMLFGRVVPTNVAPGWVFAHRPMAVDPDTAERLVQALRRGDDAEQLFQCIGDGVAAARIAPGPGLRLLTWLWSDTLLRPDDHAATGIVDGRTSTLDDHLEKMRAALDEIERRNPEPRDAGPDRLAELRGAGVPDGVASGIIGCEGALLVADMNRDGRIHGGREIAAANAAANLWCPAVVDGVREHATPPGSGPLWRDVASCVAEPFRSICIGFAETAEVKAAAA